MEQLKLGCPSLLGKANGILRMSVFCRLLVGVEASALQIAPPQCEARGSELIVRALPSVITLGSLFTVLWVCKKQNSEFLKFNPGGESWIIPVSSWIRPKRAFVPLLCSGKRFPVHEQLCKDCRAGVGNLGQVTCCSSQPKGGGLSSDSRAIQQHLLLFWQQESVASAQNMFWREAEREVLWK